MNLEKEIWSKLTKKDYEIILPKLKQQFVESKFTKRLAIQITDYNRNDLDTRIRITDGKPEIMQKIGNWTENTRTELSTQLLTDSENILTAYKTMRNLLSGDNVETAIIQTESYIFQNKNFEIKITHQYGKIDVYNYEIEVFNHDLDPLKIATDIGLPIDSPENTPEFWKDWNNTVNLITDRLTDEQLVELIGNYL